MSVADEQQGGAGVMDWELLAGIDPNTASFPAESQCAGQTIWIFRTNWGFRGVQQHCPHANVALGTAKLLGGDKMIRCALHGMTFRLEDGAGTNCRLAIKIYEVRRQEGALFARPKA
jgi:nitrite reductase/ring-hydroxylating ferredoxin subunit